MYNAKRNIEIGKLGEDYATTYLLEHGFNVLERNWRYQRWEVDIIATKNEVLHFIEVKTRTSTKYGLPETAVSNRKMEFLKNAAEAYQYAFPQWGKVQFDVIGILLNANTVKDFFVNWDVYF